MTPPFIEAIGFSAFFVSVIGCILIARKSEYGWWLYIVSSALWFLNARYMSSLAMTISSATSCILNVYILWSWRRKQLPPS